MKKLSKNEQLALNLTAKGLKNKDIAKQMTDKNGNPLNEKTISTYMRRVRQKLDIPLDKNTYFVVTKAVELGALKIG
ncbi:LuxR C-terminal-related transcriptional regulator [Hyunsoonleella rubra]|uniref:LuxR C-terminal-related transcriptional regulator n=1 Tax=Hyunsoonleella rubra TaxID=1737062 RepID=A0ABW5T618_9FLAO